MTAAEKSVIIGLALDADDMLSFHFEKEGTQRRWVFFRVRDGVVTFKHPTKGFYVPIGYAAVLGANLVIVMPLNFGD